VRRPTDVNRAVEQQKAGAGFVLGGVEDYVTAAAVVAGARILRLNVDRTGRRLCAGGEGQGVQA